MVGGRIYEEQKDETKTDILDSLEKAVKFEDFANALEENKLDINCSSAMGGFVSIGFKDIMPHKYDFHKVELISYVKNKLND